MEDCTVSLMFSGYPTVAVNMWSAIAYFQQSAGFERPVKSAALKALHLKATKLAALGANKPRDIIPLVRATLLRHERIGNSTRNRGSGACDDGHSCVIAML